MSKKDTPSEGDRSEEASRQPSNTGITGTASRRRLLHLLGAGGLAGIAGCSQEPGQGTAKGTQPAAGTATESGKELRQSLTIGHVSSQFGTFGSLAHLTRAFEPLIWETHEMRARPWLVKDWERTGEDTWEFTLRENVKYHNGDTLDADKVAARLISFLSSESWFVNASGTNVAAEGIKKLDDMTIEMTTITPTAWQHKEIAGLEVFSAHPNSSGEAWDVNDYSNLIGTGPYQIDEVKEGQHVKLSAFDDYWGGNPQTSGPHMDEITVRKFEDRNTMALALTGQKIDMAVDLPPNQLEPIKKSKDTKVATPTLTATARLGFNLQKKPTSDVKLRKALNYAVSQEELVENTQNGLAVPARGPLPPMFWASAHDLLPTYGPDKAKAKKLVKESDYNGETLEYVTTNDSPRSANLVAQVIQKAFDEIGVDMKIQVVGGSSYGERRTAGEGDLFADAEVIQFSNENYQQLRQFGTLEGGLSETGAPTQRSRQEVLDKLNPLLEKALQSTGSTYKDIMIEIQQIIMEEALRLPLFHRKYLVGMRSSIEADVSHPIPERLRIENMKYFK